MNHLFCHLIKVVTTNINSEDSRAVHYYILYLTFDYFIHLVPLLHANGWFFKRLS